MTKMNGAKNHPQQVAKRPSIDRLFDAASPTDEVDDRGTPQTLFDELNREFHFTIDVAASEKNTKCERFYDISSNGLIQDWSGESVWCNPPYSDLPSWVAKAHHEVDAETIVMLIPANRTEQPFWQTYVEPYRDGGATREQIYKGTNEVRAGRREIPRRYVGIMRFNLEVRFVNGRLNFKTPGGKFGRVPFGSAILVWSHDG